MKFFKHAQLITIVLAALAVSAFAQTAAVTAPSVSGFTEVRRETFDKVWNTVNTKHYDPTFGGVDWKAMRAKYSPLAAVAGSDLEFHNVLRDMLGELKLSHFNIFPQPPDVGGGSGVGAETGLHIIWLANEPVVLSVQPGSPAAAAGIKPGYLITAINGKKIPTITEALARTFDARKLSQPIRRVMLERTIEAILSAKADVAIKVGLRDGKGRSSIAELTPKPFAGEVSEPVGSFPKQKVLFESRLLAGNIGYIKFNMWIVPQLPKIRAAIRSFADAKGVIFDLRGNPGGIGGLAAGAAGLISDKQISLGSMTSRSGTTRLISFPQTNPFRGKIVVLTDHGSASTSEMFAAGLRENGRATIVGETTAGAILLSVFEKLPTGWIFQYVISDYRSPMNVLIEGHGVKPDVEALLTRKTLLEGRDVQLEAAIKAIDSEDNLK